MALADFAGGVLGRLQQIQREKALAEAAQQAEAAKAAQQAFENNLATQRFQATQQQNQIANAEALPAGTFLSGDQADMVPGFLRTPTPATLAMGPDFQGPMQGGETPQQAQVGRPAGFIKTATAKQQADMEATRRAELQRQQELDRQAMLDQRHVAERSQDVGFRDRQLRVQEQARTDAEKKQAEAAKAATQKATAAQQAVGDRAQEMIGLVDQLVDPKTNALTPGTAALFGHTGPIVAGLANYGAAPQATADRQATLERLKSLSIVDLINEMKSQSPTGATGFGQLSGPELHILQTGAVQLQNSQSESQAAQILSDMRKALQKVSAVGLGTDINVNPGGVPGAAGAQPPAAGTSGFIEAIDPQGNIHHAPAGTPLPQGWRLR